MSGRVKNSSIVLVLAGMLVLPLYLVSGVASSLFQIGAGTVAVFVSLFLFFYCRILLVSILLCFLPFTRGLFQFELGVITFSPFTMGVVALALVSGFEILLFKRKRQYLARQDFLVLLLGAYFLVSTVIAEDIYVVGLVAFQGLFIPICTYIVLRHNVTSIAEAWIALYGYFAGATVLSLIYIFEVLVAGSRVDILGLPAISVATILLPVVAVFVVAAARGRLGGRLLGMPAGVAFVLTYSRMYLVGLIVSPLIQAQCAKGRGRLIYTALLILTFVMTLVFTYSADSRSGTFMGMEVGSGMQHKQELKEAEWSSRRLTDQSHLVYAMYGRAIAQQYGLEQFLGSPVFGTGIRPKEAGLATQHNFHIEWLQYGGIVGYLIYASVIMLFFRRTSGYATSDPLLSGLQTGVLLLLMNSFTNGLMHGLMPVVLFMMMGLACAPGNGKQAGSYA